MDLLRASLSNSVTITGDGGKGNGKGMRITRTVRSLTVSLLLLRLQHLRALALPVPSGLYCGDYHGMVDPLRGKSPPFAPLSSPVLELITPDGCSSSSSDASLSLIRNIERAVEGGVSLVQLRDYKSDAKSKEEFATRLVAATRGRAFLVLNGQPEAARASGADGVHLPERMMEFLGGLRDAGKEWPSIVGCSVHSVAAAVKAARLGADYVQVGTMFATQSHPGKEPEGVGMLNDVRRQLQAEGLGSVLVLGVGGIDESNCGEVVAAGGDGVAAIRCLCSCSSSDAEGVARRIVQDMRVSLTAAGRPE